MRLLRENSLGTVTTELTHEGPHGYVDKWSFTTHVEAASAGNIRSRFPSCSAALHEQSEQLRIKFE